MSDCICCGAKDCGTYAGELCRSCFLCCDERCDGERFPSAALTIFGEVIAWVAALQIAHAGIYTCTECGHVGSEEDPPAPDDDKLYCGKCWDDLWSRRHGAAQFARGIAAALEAEAAARAGGWVEPPVIRVDVIADWEPVNDAWVMR